MTKTLVLVRHGNPEASATSGRDFDRQLTPSGAHALACAYPRTFSLLSGTEKPVVWSSPALRALQTADVVAAAVNADGIEPHDSLYAQDIPAFLDELAATDAQTIIAVGHAPFMDLLAARLAAGVPAFGKGSAAAIALPPDLSDASEKGQLLWFVAGPTTGAWEGLASVEGEVAAALHALVACAKRFLARPESPDALLAFRMGLRRVCSLLQFLEPWQTGKQNRRSTRLLHELQTASARLRALDILSVTVDDLVEGGELGENSLLPMACANERMLECASLLTLMKKRHSLKALSKLADELSHVSWKKGVRHTGVTSQEICDRFDAELAELDEYLFGLDLRDEAAVFAARHDAKEMHYIAERLGSVLGEERAQMSEYMDDIQRELGQLCDARRNRRLADECSKSPRFRGVRADLGVVARDQAELVSAITSGLELLEADTRADAEKHKKHKDKTKKE